MAGENPIIYVKEKIETSKEKIKIKSKKTDDVTLLYPRNIQRLDDINVVPFYQSIKPFFIPGHKVTLSLEKIDSIDGQGLALLVQLTQLAKKQKCYFALTQVPSTIARILKITEIDKLLTILPNQPQITNKKSSSSANGQKNPDDSFLDIEFMQ